MNDNNEQIDFKKVSEICSLVKLEVSNVIVGYEDVVDDFLVCLIAKGHMLIEGVPGIAKTTLAKTFSKITGLAYNRIQFTPDLLPADISGHYYFNQKENTFDLRKGPLFRELILADEINRASPKTQSALLEAMEERQITIEGNTFKLPEIFMVIATLNPIETEGVYRIPEAQLDRFMYKVKMDYISEEKELQMLYRKSHASNITIKAVEDGFIDRLVAGYEKVYVDKSILKYIRDIIIETRNRKELVLGASPRAGEHMLYAAKAYSLIHGSDYVIPDHVKAVAPKILNHRILLSIDSELEGVTVEKIIDEALDKVEVPKSREENKRIPTRFKRKKNGA
ncbi:MAG: AAA family ATPase [Candidatus Hodarchaeota archaeon]